MNVISVAAIFFTGVRHFVFASSCSVYGFAPGAARKESDPLNPQTAYARSKIATERALAEMNLRGMTTTCLRFATACGMSDRLRLDLVLNDFVASAVAALEHLAIGPPQEMDGPGSAAWLATAHCSLPTTQKGSTAGRSASPRVPTLAPVGSGARW